MCMKKMKTGLPALALFISGLLGCKGGADEENASGTMFSLLTPEQTGVSFQNTLTEGPNTNILMYEYF